MRWTKGFGEAFKNVRSALRESENINEGKAMMDWLV